MAYTTAAGCLYMILNGMVREEGLEWAFHIFGDLYADQGKSTDLEGSHPLSRVLHGNRCPRYSM